MTSEDPDGPDGSDHGETLPFPSGALSGMHAGGWGSGGSSAPPEGPRWPAGAVVAGRFRVVRLLGRGGMGEVYLAEDTRLERKVALKVLSPAVAHDPQYLQRFRKEARAAS